MNKKLKLIFTLSLILNVFLAGSLGGMVAGKMKPPPLNMEREHGNISPESREIIRKAVHQSINDSMPMMEEADLQRKSMMEALSGETINKKKYMEAAEKMAEARHALIHKRSLTTLEIAEKLSAEERTKMAQHMMKPGRFAKSFGIQEKLRHDFKHEMPFAKHNEPEERRIPEYFPAEKGNDEQERPPFPQE